MRKENTYFPREGIHEEFKHGLRVRLAGTALFIETWLTSPREFTSICAFGAESRTRLKKKQEEEEEKKKRTRRAEAEVRIIHTSSDDAKTHAGLHTSHGWEIIQTEIEFENEEQDLRAESASSITDTNIPLKNRQFFSSNTHYQ